MPDDRIGVRTQLSASARIYPSAAPGSSGSTTAGLLRGDTSWQRTDLTLTELRAALTELSPGPPGFSIGGPPEGLVAA